MKTTNEFREWLNEVNLSQSECARHFGIPLRTVQNWALGERECPAYTLKMMQDALNPAKTREMAAMWNAFSEATELSYNPEYAGAFIRAIFYDEITINTDRRNHSIAWFIYGDGQAAYYMLEERFLSDEEIENYLC